MFSLFTNSKIIPDLSFIGVDMHSHLLPGIDDGLQKTEDTVSFMKELYQLGYKKFICTPHVMGGVHANSPGTILPVLSMVKDALKQNGIPVDIEAAAEYMIDHEFEQSIVKKDPLLIFAKKYILVEMSYVAASPFLNQVIFNLQLEGLQPVLAHPERYNYYHSKFSNYEKIKDRGCLFQVNILSLSGYYGKQVKAIAEKLLKAKMVEFVGTDMHHQNHLDAVKKFTSTKQCYHLLKDVALLNATL